MAERWNRGFGGGMRLHACDLRLGEREIHQGGTAQRCTWDAQKGTHIREISVRRNADF